MPGAEQEKEEGCGKNGGRRRAEASQKQVQGKSSRQEGRGRCEHVDGRKEWELHDSGVGGTLCQKGYRASSSLRFFPFPLLDLLSLAVPA